MTSRLTTRLARLEAEQPTLRRPLSPDARRTLYMLQGAIISHYLGGWRPGADAFAALDAGLAAATPPHHRPSFDHALQQAEHRCSGQAGCWQSLARLKAAFAGIGEHRLRLAQALEAILERRPDLIPTGEAT